MARRGSVADCVVFWLGVDFSPVGWSGGAADCDGAGAATDDWTFAADRSASMTVGTAVPGIGVFVPFEVDLKPSVVESFRAVGADGGHCELDMRGVDGGFIGMGGTGGSFASVDLIGTAGGGRGDLSRRAADVVGMLGVDGRLSCNFASGTFDSTCDLGCVGDV